jgi:ribonucleoside-diphosphate reductase beta chain
MDRGTDDGLDPSARSYRYYRNAVERHWDPATVDLSTDGKRLTGLDPERFDGLRRLLALFGAGETAVTEDLAPLAVVMEDVNDQLFLTTQLYEEAKHADFFDRYWREVIWPAEDDRGLDRSRPTDERWFNPAYEELFERNEAAMARLLTEDTPETRARAYCHYHLAVEGILAQTGYYGAEAAFSGDSAGVELPGLVEGFRKIRGDEGRHVGFGMAKLKELVGSGAVDPQLLTDLTTDLAGLVRESVSAAAVEGGVTEGTDLAAYATEKHTDRLRQIVESDASLPDLEELVALDRPGEA